MRMNSTFVGSQSLQPDTTVERPFTQLVNAAPLGKEGESGGLDDRSKST